jgi:glycine betaine/proline transport system substrate-binding protein
MATHATTSARTSRWRRLRLPAMMMALTLLLIACNGADDAAAPADDDETPAAAANGEIHLGWIPWDENIANTFLWKEILEQEGYEVTETQLDVAPVFDGVASGDLDLFLDVWLPETHADYWEEYSASVEDLGTWYEGAALTIAVPDYVDAQSIADLEGMGDELGEQIVGIEPGAGLTRITREEVMPAYGLDGWNLVESSTPAMLAELETAIGNDEAVVVTLWRPHWAYAAFDIRDLEDPEGTLGEAEELHAIAREGFAEDFDEVAQWLERFEMTADGLAELSVLIQEHGDGNEQDAAREWIDGNRDTVDSWLGR